METVKKVKKVTLVEFVATFNSRVYPHGCYRCWQVGKQTRAIYGVIYNKGTSHEWRSISCESCLTDDITRFPNAVTVVLKDENN